MKTFGLTLTTIIFFSLSVSAQEPVSATDSVSLESPIKALSNQEYFDLKTGKEMGMARVAELNSYPAPEEVAKLDKKLSLSASQIGQLKKIIDAWRFKTQEMGGFILAQEEKLNNLFAAGKATDGAIIYYTNKIGLYLGELRNAHLQAHLKTRNILTKEQIRKYNQIKGYSN